ncbi:MAG: hypothetical protein LBQ54_08945 [Planctomycetaceae bacterium]|nr:hypothetical protein [Planctomycetaceae bacterium]
MLLHRGMPSASNSKDFPPESDRLKEAGSKWGCSGLPLPAGGQRTGVGSRMGLPSRTMTRSRWSLVSIGGKTFPTEAEGYCGEAASFPPAANARALDPCREPRRAVCLPALSCGRRQLEKSFHWRPNGTQ